MLGKLMDALDYVGVMAMECFRVGDDLLINELAPRVHNSGHWTQAGSNVCQFENHVRAVMGLPLVSAEIKNQSMMVNLIGVDLDYQWLSIPSLELYWYQKDVRPGRKVGHLNFCTGNLTVLNTSLDRLNMPAPYPQAIEWLKANLPV